jgi:nucleoside-diphosphate-sugar epimerase
MSGKTALVTGATGFIGGRLAERLLAAGWTIKVLVRDQRRLAQAVRKAATVIEGDLADLAALEKAVKEVAVVFHCAANVHTWDTLEAYQQTNVSGLVNILNAVIQHNPSLARFVHLSSVDVYGFPQQACDEHAITLATGFGYGDSKILGEYKLRELAASHAIPYTIIRPTNVMGPNSPFIERIGAELRAGLMLTIDGGKANAGFIDVDNLVDYMIWAAEAECAISQCYNARDDYDMSWAYFLRDFKQAIHGRGLIINLSFAVADSLAWIIEGFYRVFLPRHEPLLHRLLVRIFGRTCGHYADKIRRDSGFSGKFSYQHSFQRSAQWFLNHHV